MLFNKLTVSSASGDQARDLMKQDGNFKVFAAQARIFPDDVERVEEYVVPTPAVRGTRRRASLPFMARIIAI